MRPTVVTVIVAVIVACATQTVFAEQPGGLRAPLAATAELPAALQAIGAGPAQVLPSREAAAIRGEWWLYLPLRSGTISLQGIGPFSIGVWTESQVYPAQPVGFRLSIGR